MFCRRKFQLQYICLTILFLDNYDLAESAGAIASYFGNHMVDSPKNSILLGMLC